MPTAFTCARPTRTTWSASRPGLCSELPRSAVALRSQKVADFEPIAVSQIRIKSPVQNFLLKKESNDWLQKEPKEENADSLTVATLLKELDSLETSEFLEPGKVRNPQLNPPLVTIQLTETHVGRAAASAARDELVLDLADRPVRYGTQSMLCAGSPMTRPSWPSLTPSWTCCPRTRWRFVIKRWSIRPRQACGNWSSPAPVGSTSSSPSKAAAPIAGGCCGRSMPRRIAARSPRSSQSWPNLRADSFVADTQKDATKFGLDHPLLDVEWETDRPHRLKVGAQVPHEPAYYATTLGDPNVFTLSAETLKPFEAEFRDHVVMSFPLAEAERMVLSWSRPDRTLALRYRQPTAKGQLEWFEEPGQDSRGIDLSAATALARALSHLETVRYSQYDGAIEPFTGLVQPRLTVTVKLGANEPDRIMRIGHPAAPGLIYAALGTSTSGPVFLLPGVSWDALIKSGQRLPNLPSNVFATPGPRAQPLGLNPSRP